MACEKCFINKPIIIRQRNKMKVCKMCFFELFETEIHELITSTNMFPRGWKVGIGVSGGKDSTVLAFVLNKLNIKYKYGIELFLLCIDEGIEGYRDRSIETVNENQKELKMNLKILSYKDLFGVTMDEVVSKIGKKGNCTYCGAFRRQALEEAAREFGVDCIVTGHNADDMAETVLLNLLRGDISRIKRCTSSKTNEQKYKITDEDFDNYTTLKEKSLKYLSLPRCKPFKYTYQKEIVFYAYFKKLKYFSTECTYAPGASRGDVRDLIKDLEKIDSKIIINLIKSMEEFSTFENSSNNVFPCKKCFNSTSSKDKICNACNMLEKLKN